VIAAGLAGRSALDKVLALRGGGELVALWAQVASLMELVSGVALAGLGTGLAVYAARTRRPDRHGAMLVEALRTGLAVSAPVALLAAAAGFLFSAGLSPWLVVLGAVVGWIGVVPGLVGSLWLGQQRREAQLALAVVGALLSLGVALTAPSDRVLVFLVLTQALLVLAVLFARVDRRASLRMRAHARSLRSYVVPSIAIGILSPASMMVARAVVGDALSWHDAGVLQALWRVQDWVCGFASGVLSVYFLPQLAAAGQGERFAAAVRNAAAWVVLPSAVVLGLFFLAHGPLLAALYDDSFRVSDTAAALFFLGALARIASWAAMFGLYAARRTGALAVGELLSLPLFATLVVIADKHLTLELAGAFWLASYCAYAGFNFWALRRR
jgi:O-antigen/teichoic acid export membrane protein